MNLTILKAWLQAKFSSDETGAALVEYALLVALIAVVCIVAITFLGGAPRAVQRDRQRARLEQRQKGRPRETCAGPFRGNEPNGLSSHSPHAPITESSRRSSAEHRKQARPAPRNGGKT